MPFWCRKKLSEIENLELAISNLEKYYANPDLDCRNRSIAPQNPNPEESYK